MDGMRYRLSASAIAALLAWQSALFASECREMAFQGIKAGMTEADFKSSFNKCFRPHESQGTPNFVDAGIGVYEECFPISENYAGWRVAYIRFYRGKLDYAQFDLVGKENPKRIDDFIRALTLPGIGWEPDNELPSEYEGYAAKMSCGAVEYRISTGLAPNRPNYADYPKFSIEDNSNSTPPQVLRNASKNPIDRQLAGDFEVSRFYSLTSNYAVAVIETRRTMNVKCVVRSGEGKSVAVETAKITPPADEVTFLVSGADAAAVSCQEIE